MDIQLTEKQRELIEQMGVFYEQMGMPPTESRIISLLTVCDETELTFDQIRELLSISKSATSNALNLLLLSQQATYRTKLGDRKRYFSTNMVNWEENVTNEFQKIFKVTVLLKEALEQRTPDTPKFNEQLATFIEFMEYIGVELPQLLEKWKQRKQTDNSNKTNTHES